MKNKIGMLVWLAFSIAVGEVLAKLIWIGLTHLPQ
jgi:hypothetical protein